MTLDPATVDERDVLRALTACLAPRPVALVSTISRDGVANAAPFSMVTPLSASPALLGLAIHPRSDGRRKRTLASIEEVGDFVVNAVTLALLPAAVESSVDAPEGRPVAGLRFVPSDLVRSPRVAASPINLECRLAEVIRPARSQASFVVGEVVRVHVDGAPAVEEPWHVFHTVGHLATPARGEYLFVTVGEVRRIKV
jgi:flavin reductase (DIM6/NTAB) family NADH-FMN oxidoreductase RutF